MLVVHKDDKHFLFSPKESVDMKHISIPQIRAISGNTPQEAALLFNQTIMELAPLSPTWTREGDTYYITTMVEYDEAESLAEMAEINGDDAKCIACPFCVRDPNRFGYPDTRKKWATCGQTGKRIRIDARACEDYYRNREERRANGEES